jgi:hypothetical protein
MRKTFTATMCLLLIAANVYSADFVGTPPAGNWNKVQSLSQGAALLIGFSHGVEMEGEFVRLAEDSILMRVYETERMYPKASIVRIKMMRRPGSRARNAAIVGGIFFGAGFGLGFAGGAWMTDRNSASARERVQAGAGVGAILGGVAGAITAAHRPGPRSEVIYRAR